MSETEEPTSGFDPVSQIAQMAADSNIATSNGKIAASRRLGTG